MLTRLFKPVQLLYALLRLLFAFEVEFQPQGIIQIETSLDCLGLPCVCVCASRLGRVMSALWSRNSMIWILGDCRCQSLEASFLPELLGRTKTNWNWPHSRSAACCGAEDISSRAGLSSRASTKTYERVHTSCSEINELSGRNYRVWSLLIHLL